MNRSAKPASPAPQSPPASDGWRRDLSTLVLLALATLIIFLPLIRAEFVNYDDPDYVTNNVHIRGMTGANIAWAFGSLFIYWQPLTWLSYMADYELCGLKAFGFHLTNLALHMVNSVVLFLFLKCVTRTYWRTLFVTLLFAIHPLHVETVAWISERKGVLSTLFWFLALAAYARYAKRPGVGRYLVVAVCFALGLMAKSMLVTLPFLLLLLDWWPLRRFQSSPHSVVPPRAESNAAVTRLPQKTLGFLLLEKLPLLALSVVSGVLAMLAQRKADALVTLQGLPFADRLANSLLGYGRYLIQTLWPVDLVVFYPRAERWMSWQVALAAAVVLGLSALAFVWMRRRPHVFVGWFWFLGTLVPVIGLMQVGDQAIADRYTYVPLVGLFILAAWEVTALVGTNPFWRNGLAGGGVAAAIVCAALTFRQARHWQSTQTLFEHAYRVDPDNPQVCAVVGSLRSAEGRYDDAIRLFEHALSVNPNQSDAHVHLGLALEKLDKPEEAAGHYLEAIRIKPSYVDAHLFLGMALSRQGKPADAVEQFQTALQLRPDSATAHNNLAMVLYAQGKAEEAIAYLEAALRIDPNLATAHENLAIALLAKGDAAQATAHLRAALAVAPQSAMLHLRLGRTLLAQGQTAETLDHLREALRLRPDWPELLNDLAWILATHSKAEFRNGVEAVQLAEKACRLTDFKRAMFVGTLAAAQAEAGRYDDALRTAQRAHDLAIAAGDKALAETNLKLIELYRAGKPVRSEL
jgi:tetratricopeptide (TPR) repeat protein